MFVDECMAKQTRVSFARMLIKVNITKLVLDKISVKDPQGRIYIQTVLYEWKPLFYEACQTTGHKCDNTHQLAEQVQPRRRA